MNTQKNLENFANFINDIASEAFDELGSGFKEDTYQKALAISLRKNKIKYLKELNLEIFFKNESLGIFRIDFLIPKQKGKKFNLSKPIIIETKCTSNIKNDARLQLKNYLISLPCNSSEVLSQVTEGIVLNWRNNQTVDEESSEGVDIEMFALRNNKFKLIYHLPHEN